MSRKQLLVLSGLALVAGLVLWLAVRNREPPLLPTDEAHLEFSAPEACLTCHAPGTPLAQSSNHPIGRECLRCHGRR